MKIVGHGLDIVEVGYYRRLREDPAGENILGRIFTHTELALAGSGPRCAEHLAGRFAAKEAVLKALGTGWTQGIAWTEVEIGALPIGAPIVTLSGRAAEIAKELNITSWLVSISHTDALAAASVIGVSETENS